MFTHGERDQVQFCTHSEGCYVAVKKNESHILTIGMFCVLKGSEDLQDTVQKKKKEIVVCCTYYDATC